MLQEADSFDLEGPEDLLSLTEDDATRLLEEYRSPALAREVRCKLSKMTMLSRGERTGGGGAWRTF